MLGSLPSSERVGKKYGRKRPSISHFTPGYPAIMQVVVPSPNQRTDDSIRPRSRNHPYAARYRSTGLWEHHRFPCRPRRTYRRGFAALVQAETGEEVDPVALRLARALRHAEVMRALVDEVFRAQAVAMLLLGEVVERGRAHGAGASNQSTTFSALLLVEQQRELWKNVVKRTTSTCRGCP